MKKFFDWNNGEGPDKNKWLIAVLVGALLLVVALPTGAGKDRQSGQLDKNTKNGVTESGSTAAAGGKNTAFADRYREELEEELEEMLAHMEGVGKVKVMITLKDSGESVVEKDRTDSSTVSEETGDDAVLRSETQLQSEETTVYADRESNEPFISKENRPAVEGVLVLAEGGGDTAVKQNISDAVLALFHVDAHKIKVVKMSVQEGTE